MELSILVLCGGAADVVFCGEHRDFVFLSL